MDKPKEGYTKKPGTEELKISKENAITKSPATDSSVGPRSPKKVPSEDDSRKRKEPSPDKGTIDDHPAKKTSFSNTALPSSAGGNASTGTLARTFGSGLKIGPSFSGLAGTSSSIFASQSKESGDGKEAEPSKASLFQTAAVGSFLTSKPLSPSDIPEVVTGEEADIILFKARAQLKIYDADKKEWKQRGQGPVHLNLQRDQNVTKARLIMRNMGTLGLLLNTFLFKDMSPRRSGERTLIVGIIDGGKFESKLQADTAYSCIQNCKTQETAAELLERYEAGEKNVLFHYDDNKDTNEESQVDGHSESEVDDEEGEFDEYQPAS